MKSYSLTLGARNTPAAGRRFSRRDDEAIREITRQYFPSGFTIMDADGGWWDPEQKAFKQEEARQIIVRSNSIKTIHLWSRTMGAYLGQKELLVFKLGTAVVIRIRKKE